MLVPEDLKTEKTVEGPEAQTDQAFDNMRVFMEKFHRVMLRTFRCPRPVVAAVNGHAVAGGCVLAMQADVRIAGGRRLLIAGTVVARGRRLTRLRCGSLSVFNDRNSLPQATRALAFGTASVIETAPPSRATRLGW